MTGHDHGRDRSEAIISYECRVSGEEHDVPGPEVRVLKVGDGGFKVVCGCGPESVEEAEAAPHPITAHLANIRGDAPSPEQWLRLEEATDGWYNTTAWDSPDGFEGVNGQRRARFRERVESAADSEQSFEASASGEAAKAVGCPNCEAEPGQKCKRPSGHAVKKPHSERVTAAEDAGVIGGRASETSEQAALDDGWSA